MFQPFELQLLSQLSVIVPDVTIHLRCSITFYEMSVIQRIQTSSQMAVTVALLYEGSNISGQATQGSDHLACR